MPAFRRRLDALEDAVSSTEGRILVGGDFNARALEWSKPQSDSRGKRILEMAARTGLVVLNTGSTRDTAGKVLEKLIRSRIAEVIRATGDSSQRQVGFRIGKSTVDAIKEVVDVVHRAEAHSRRSRRIEFLITLDVRNALNAVRWTNMLGTLENSFHVPSYLLRILRDYLKEGQKRMEITSGVTQGSILEPDLWNAMIVC